MKLLVTGSSGLIGSEACRRFHAEGLDIAGVDNDMRSYFFGAGASTGSTRARCCVSWVGPMDGCLKT